MYAYFFLFNFSPYKKVMMHIQKIEKDTQHVLRVNNYSLH